MGTCNFSAPFFSRNNEPCKIKLTRHKAGTVVNMRINICSHCSHCELAKSPAREYSQLDSTITNYTRCGKLYRAWRELYTLNSLRTIDLLNAKNHRLDCFFGSAALYSYTGLKGTTRSPIYIVSNPTRNECFWDGFLIFNFVMCTSFTHMQKWVGGELVSFPDHFLPHGKNWSGERPIRFLFPAIAKIVT